MVQLSRGVRPRRAGSAAGSHLRRGRLVVRALRGIHGRRDRQLRRKTFCQHASSVCGLGPVSQSLTIGFMHLRTARGCKIPVAAEELGAPQADAEPSVSGDALLAATLSDRVVAVTEAARPCKRWPANSGDIVSRASLPRVTFAIHRAPGCGGTLSRFRSSDEIVMSAVTSLPIMTLGE